MAADRGGEERVLFETELPLALEQVVEPRRRFVSGGGRGGERNDGEQDDGEEEQ